MAAELGLPLREVQEVCTLEPGASLVSGIVGLRSDAEASATIHVVERTTLGSGVRTYMVTLHARGGAWVPQPLELPARAYGPC